MTLQRMQHNGAAPATGVQAHIASGDTSFTILSGSGYPDGSVGPFIIALDPGTASEEKVLCSGRAGTTVNVAPGGRGYDGTSAQAHSVGTTNVQHVFGAVEADDDNDHIYTTTRDDHTQYARTDGTRAITGTQHFSSQIVVATGETITSGGLTVSAGATNVQVLTATTGSFTSTLGVTGATTLTGGVSGAMAATGAVSGTTVTGTGEVKGTDFNTTGLTGATTGGRLVGATAGGPPASGTFSTGDVVIDTKYGMHWVCTSGGTSGTWVNAGGGNVYCQGYRNGAWTTNSGVTTLVYDTALNDPNSMLATGTGIITVPVAGLYVVNAQYRNTTTTATQTSSVNVVQNSTTVASASGFTNTAETNGGWTGVSCTVLCAASDTLHVTEQTSTNGLTGTTGQANTFFHVRLT